MTIRSRTAQLDDASGELTLALAKLELEAAHGTPNKDEQIDFVRDLSRVALKERIRPWRLRAVQALKRSSDMRAIAALAQTSLWGDDASVRFLPGRPRAWAVAAGLETLVQ